MNKKTLILIISLLLNFILGSLFAYKLYNNWFEIGVLKDPFRNSIFDAAPMEHDKYYFVGDSNTEAFELNELLQNDNVRNRGIWGDVSSNVLKRIDNVLERKPKKIFIMIGVNDICSGVSVDNIKANVESIIKKTRRSHPGTRIYIESVLPTSKEIKHSTANATEKIKLLNEKYEEMCRQYQLEFIDLFPHFVQDNRLKQEYSFDGLHLNGNGYVLLAKLLKPYVDN